MKLVKDAHNLTAFLFEYALRIIRFLFVIFVFVLIYQVLLDQFFDGSKELYPLLIFWVLTAYVVIPRIHRTLAKYYLPNYYVGRTRSPSGFLSDPINLAFIGTAKDLHDSLENAGWVRAEKLTVRNFARAAVAVVFRRSYPSAPVGHMYLFNRVQDFAYEQEVGGTPNERHHMRIWRAPEGWYLPGGHKADWLVAATYDTHMGLKIATGQIDHLIHENIDEERDYIIQTLKDANTIKRVEVVKHFTDAYHDRNNGGDRIKTDGSLPFIHL